MKKSEKSENTLAELKQQILEFIKDLRDNMFEDDSERAELLLVEIFFKGMREKDIMDHVIERILPRKREIEKRKVDFFYKNRGDIFSGLPKDRIDFFANFLANEIDDDQREPIWEYFDTFIDLAEKYKKNK